MVEQLDLFPDSKASLRIDRVVKRSGRVVAFDPEKITNAIYRAAVEMGGSDRELAGRLARELIRMLNEQYPPQATPSVEEIQDLVERVLIENGHARTAKAFILHRARHAAMREQREKAGIQAMATAKEPGSAAGVSEDTIPYKVIYEVFTWNVDHGCDSAENINKRTADGGWPKLIEACEKRYHDEIARVAQKIIAEKARVRIMIVAGPSSSGKTTTTMKIAERLKEQGLSLQFIALDNYFKDLESHPKDEYGDYDFETPEALDLALINQHLADLMKGKTVQMPYYNFKTGKRVLNATPFKLEKGQILLIDSLHGLYGPMTESVPDEMKFKFYIEAMCQIRDAGGEFVRWADLRMLRRMIRDSWHRSYDPDRTVGHWHYVRRSEKRHIVPFIHTADFIFNGALGYELPVHRRNLLEPLARIIEKYGQDPKKVDAFIRAQRVQRVLGGFADLKDEQIAAIPGDSLLREFIGGSTYKY